MFFQILRYIDSGQRLPPPPPPLPPHPTWLFLKCLCHDHVLVNGQMQNFYCLSDLASCQYIMNRHFKASCQPSFTEMSCLFLTWPYSSWKRKAILITLKPSSWGVSLRQLKTSTWTSSKLIILQNSCLCSFDVSKV